MHTAIHKLIFHSEPASSQSPSGRVRSLVERFGPRGAELAEVLQISNGLLAFESALELFADAESADAHSHSLAEWNEPATWRSDYGDLITKDVLFFGQDVFGGQFALDSESIYSFDPETAEFEAIAGSLEQFAGLLLRDYEFLTGYPLAHEWQTTHGPLKPGERLIPKIPFVLGGEYELSNLYCGPILPAMKFRASLARQIRDLPDGTPISIQVSP